MTNWINEVTSCVDLGGGHFQTVIGLKPRAHPYNGGWRENVPDWEDGDQEYPDVVSRVPLPVRSAGDGRYRLYPVPGDLSRYAEIARPYRKPAGTWQPFALGNKSRTGTLLSWTGPEVDLNVTMAGHYLGWEMPLKGGYVPPSSQFAVPMALVGLKRQGSSILVDGGILDGVPVLTIRPPHVYDAANPMDSRPIAWQFGAIGGQSGVLFTLPSLAGMSRPIVDPTLALQPGAADGKDTTLALDLPTWNFGALTVGAIGERNDAIGQVRRLLIQFSLSAMPSTAVISAATLSLYVTVDYSSNARTLRVYRQKMLWLEGTSLGAATGDGATWNTYDGSHNWQTAGGFGINDCEQTEIGNRTFTATETINEFKSITLTPTTKAALDLGYGWLIKMDTEVDDAYQVALSDHATAAYLPKLTVEWMLAGGGGRFPVLSRFGGMR